MNLVKLYGKLRAVDLALSVKSRRTFGLLSDNLTLLIKIDLQQPRFSSEIAFQASSGCGLRMGRLSVCTQLKTLDLRI